MRKLIIIFLAICVFKLISFTSRKYFDRHHKEHYDFIDRELTIKNSEHYKDLFYLRHLTDYNSKIPSFLSEKLEKYDSRYSEDGLLPRIWFQDYAQSLNLKDSAYDNHAFPSRLQNTVAEEIAKNKIIRYYKSHQWLNTESGQNQKVKGIIDRLFKSGDSLSIRIIPFSYDVTTTFNNCQSGSTYVPAHSNPFYYEGSLSRFSCEIRNQVTNEVITRKFH
ncbi:MAG TPA: hypothetical protein VFG10_13630 [Saprospiraceae bacterium]|nr:hypothetical protein [Saprospiraceae bacterium]